MIIIVDTAGETISRILLVKIKNRIVYKFKFDGTILSDSEALHNLLCEIDPGSTYSLSFRNGK